MSSTTAPTPTTDPGGGPAIRFVLPADPGPGAGHATVVHLRGELDLLTAPPLLPTLLRLPVPPGGELVLDLSEVSFCDSSAVTLFLRLARRMRTGTALRLSGVAGQPARVLRLLRVPAAIACDFAGTDR